MRILAVAHVVGATSALLLGALVLMLRKGTHVHRRIGRLYVCSMLVVNVAALLVFRRTGEWGPFHLLALISLGTLAAGTVPFFFGRRGRTAIVRHSYFMAWSYVGLVAAGVAQLTTQVLSGDPWRSVALPAIVIVVAGAVAVHWFTPRALAALAHLRRQEGRQLENGPGLVGSHAQTACR